MHTRIVCLSAVLLLANVALAQKSPRPGRPPAASPSPKRFDFDDDEVTAGVPLPREEVVSARGRVRFDSLIRVRTTFVPEILKTAQER